MKKGIFALIFGIVLILSVDASMVSFCVVETGLPLEGAKNLHSQRWENTFMDVFFEAGYIVSNAPIQRLESIPEDDITDYMPFDMESARDAGIDYVLIAQLDYADDSACPKGVSFVLYTITKPGPNTAAQGMTFRGCKIFEKRFSGKKYGSSRDEVEDIKKIVREVIPYISE